MISKIAKRQLQAICSDAGSAQGLSPSLVLLDETQEQKDRSLHDSLLTGMGAREQPLFISIGTAGWDRRSLFFELVEHGKQVATGAVDDPTFLPLIYTSENDYTKESTWREANPNYGVSIYPEFLKQECERAKRSPLYEGEFRRKYLCQWTEAQSRFLNSESWSKTRNKLPDLKHKPAVLAFDLSSTRDLSAVVLAVKDYDKVYIIDKSFIPEERLHERERQDRVPYSKWIESGHIEATDGNVIDYQRIKRYILDLTTQYAIEWILYDPWNASGIAAELYAEGLRLDMCRQGFGSLSEPTKKLEQLVMSGNLIQDSPVLDWQAANLCCKSDDNGNIRPIKPDYDSPARIDTMVATIMCLRGLWREEFMVQQLPTV